MFDDGDDVPFRKKATEFATFSEAQDAPACLGLNAPRSHHFTRKDRAKEHRKPFNSAPQQREFGNDLLGCSIVFKLFFNWV